MKLRVLLLMFIMSFCGEIFTASAQPLVDIGLYNNGNDTLEVKLIPRGFFSGVASNVVFTIRWESSCGSSLGNIVQSGTPATYIPMVKSGTPKNANVYTYQVFGGAGLQALSTVPVSWTNGVPVTLLKVPVTNPNGTFEIVNDSWTGVVTNNGDFFVSLNGMKKTGSISQGKFSFTQTGTASICVGDSILLGGLYRKLPGTYYDTLQGACKRIILTTLTVTGAITSNHSVSICQGQSYFAGGAWQTTSGTYYDSYDVGTGCDSAIITQLTVHPGYFNTVNIQICIGQSIIAGGDYQTQTGIYYDTLSSRFGCDSVIATNLQALSQLSFTKNVSICAGQSYFAGGANRTVSGTYYDSYVSSGGCDSVVATVLNVNPNPVATISPSSVTICSGESSILTAGGGSSFIWNTGTTSPAIIVTPASSTTYSVTVTNSSGCTASASRSVTVNSSPAAIVFPPSVTICNGESATLTTSGGTSYAWSNGVTIAFITVNPTVTSAYSVTITNASGCTAATSRTVTVNPLPAASISPATAAICNGASTTLTASGGVSYIWNNGATSASIAVNPTFVTNYSVTVTSVSGCTAATSRTVLVNGLPTAAISPVDVSICSGASATLTASGGASYSWNTGATAENLTVYPTVTTGYSVTVTNLVGCTATASRTIIVNPLPAASISPAAISVCEGASATLTASEGASYSWNTGETGTSIIVNPGITSIYSTTVTDTNGCTASTSRMVTVNTLPVASITPATAATCNGASTTLTASGGTSYVWGTTETDASIVVNPVAATNYSVTVTDANGCTAETSRIVTVNALPTASILVADDTLCLGESTTLTASGGVSYQWNTGATDTSISVSPVATTAYSVTVTDVNGCTAATSRTVSINSLPAAFIFPPSVTICNGASATLTSSGGISYVWNNGVTSAFITVNPTISTIYSVTITNANGCTAITSRTVTVNPLPVASISPATVSICRGSNVSLTADGGTSFVWSTGVTSAGIKVNPFATTTYFVTVTDANGCTSTTSRMVTVNPLPSSSISPAIVSICNGQSATLTASGGVSLTWSTGAINSSITVSPASNSSYSVTVIDANGCSAASSRLVSVNPLPAASISPASVFICTGDNATLTASGGTTYTWSTGVSDTSIVVNPATSTTYSVTVTGSNGCSVATSRTVNVNPLPVAAITPSSASICPGSSATLTASGGTTYSWSNGSVSASTIVSPDTTTSYFVTVTDINGCIAAASGTVAVREDLAVSISPSDPMICIGQSTVLTASGGINYSWSTGATTPGITVSPVSMTSYLVTVTDGANCTATASETVIVNALPSASITPADVAICQGVSATLTASGGISYLWNMGAATSNIILTPSGTTNYSVTVTDNFGCTATALRTISVNALPVISISPADAAICNGESITLTASGGTSYSWSNLVATAGNTVSPASSTNYSVTATDASGCTGTASGLVTVKQHVVTTNEVRICNGENYFVGGGLRQTAGTYYDTLTAANGCDSIVATNLVILPTYSQDVFLSICPGESHFAGGAMRTKTGVYTDLFTASNGCDSTVITHLLVLPNNQSSRYKSICEGDSLFVGGAYQKNSGIFRDTLAAANGCDSVIVTTLAVQQTVIEIIQIGLCGGDSLFAGGEYQTMTGNYYDTLQGSKCDSVIITSLTIFEPIVNIISVSICSNENYFAGGANQTLSGIYYDTLVAANGCDSIVTTLLQVNQAYSITRNLTICEGESIYAGGGFQISTGIYIDTYTAINGCDSIITTSLLVLPVSQTSMEIERCSGESYFAGGANQTQSGIYFDTLAGLNGCDSVIITSLTVSPAYSFTRDVYICRGDNFFAGGLFRNTAGIYRDTFTSSAACDSIIITNLTINPTNLKKIDAHVCDGDSLFVGGAWQTSPGVYYDTLSNRFGCDSIVRTKLTIEVIIHVNLDMSICFGDSLYAGGSYQHSDGTYYDTLSASGGCDSVVITNLSVIGISMESIAVQLCAGDSLFAGKDYQFSAGTYVDTFTSANGCDSIVSTTLSVLPVNIDTFNVVICNGESYFTGGANQTLSGIYSDTFTAANGCDSIRVTLLTVNPTYGYTREIFICTNDSFFAGGSFRHTAGFYYDTFTSISGCDSILITDLKVTRTNLKKIDARVCNGDSLFVGGAWQVTPGIYFDTLNNRFGCDSVVRTKLTIELAIHVIIDALVCEGDSLFSGGAYQSFPGVYFDTLTATGGCDSIVITNLAIKGIKSENVAIQLCYGDSVYAGGGFRKIAGFYYDTISQVSGCDSIIITDVSIIPPVVDTLFIMICDNESVMIGGKWENTSGTYYDTLSAANGCDSLVVTMLDVVSTFITSVNISSCEGESYFAGGAYRIVNGIYHDTFTSMSGCDSVVTTILNVLQQESTYNPVTICRGQSYFAGGWERTTAGIYSDTFFSAHGCDSIVLTLLNVRPSITKTVSVEICDNEEYFAGGDYRNVPGVYRDTFTTAMGCDSIVSTILNVNESFLLNRDISICSGDSIFLQGEFRSDPGLYYDTLAARNVCDSIIATNLLIKNQSLTSRTITICEEESFFAGGADQLDSGIYSDTLLNVNGCDSLVVTELVVILSKRSSFDISICNGETYFAGGADRSLAGTYFDTLTSNLGCDSIVTTHLNILPRYTTMVPVSICFNETYFAAGAFQNLEGSYFDTLTAVNGCDSIVITALEVLPVYADSIQVTICTHENYFAGGGYQNSSGSYVDTFSSHLGCDSVVMTDLIVLSDFTSTNAVSICEGSGYFAQGTFRTVTGNYFDTIGAPNGCYNIIRTELNVMPKNRTDLSISICEGESHFAQGALQIASGEYIDRFFAINGCDSLVITHLTVLPKVSDTIDVEICSNERYFAQGAFRNTSGVYYDILHDKNGCDSTVITNLNVMPVSSLSLNVAICASELYFAGGALQNTSGIYYDTLIASSGCDSIVVTNLSVLPVYSINVNHEMCQGDSFFVAGAFQSSAGVYYDTLISFSGCDSIIITNLSVLPVHVTNIDVSVCDDEPYYTGGAYQNASGIYFDTLANRFGCDSIIITNLTVFNSVVTTISPSICEGNSYFAGAALQTQSGIYFDYLTDRHGCDSTIVTNLTVFPAKYHSNVVSICSNDSIYLQGAYRHLPGTYQDTFVTASGCDSIIKTQLTIRPARIVYQYFTICSSESILLGGSNQSSSGTYYDTLSAFNGCDSIIISYLAVFPATSSSHSYTICDGEGLFIAGVYRSTPGIYVDTLIAFNGCDSVVTTSLQVNPNPVADAGSDRTICNGVTTTLAATGGDAYLWSTSESTATITITPSNTITLSVLVTNSFGCSDSDSVTIFVNPLLLVSFTGLDTAYCTNEEGDTLIGSPAGGTFIGPGLSGNIFNPELLISGYHIITYMYTDSQGCQASSSGMVKIKVVPQASFMGLDSSYCFEAVSNLLTGFPAGGYFSGSGITGNEFVPSDAGVGSHSIAYEYASSEGCFSTDSRLVSVLALPQIDFQITDSVLCITEAPALLHATPGGGSYSGAGVVDSSFHPELAGVARHAITYTCTGANGCSASLSREVQVRNNPQAFIEGLSAGYCISNGDVALSANPPGGLFLGNGVSNSTFNTLDAGVGEHFISYLYVDQYYCAAFDTAIISVYETPVVKLDGISEQYCVDASPIYLSGTPPGGAFHGKGVVVNVFDARKAGVGGPYPVAYNYVDAHGCMAADTQWVTVNPLPVLAIDNNSLTFCLTGSAIDLPITPAGGVFHGPGITNSLFDPSLAGLGAHTIIYTFTDSNQCSSTTGVKLLVEVCTGIGAIPSSDWQVYPNPFVNFIHLQSDSQGNSPTIVHLSDILGQTVFNQTIPFLTGMNTISLTLPEWLAPGVYHIEILSGDKMYVKKLFKAY